MQEDKAGKQYWDDVWQSSQIPDEIDINNDSLNNYVNLQFHEYFKEKIYNRVQDRSRVKVLEIGCGRSVWLPYFKKNYGFEIFGLDYSELGCKQAEKILSETNVNGEIYNEDLFNPPKDLLESFDIVVSFGVVEHFEDTNNCLSALSKFLKPNGILFTNIPNMNGLTGFLQYIIDKKIYNIHVPLDSEDLKKAHFNTDLNVLECAYFMSINLNVINYGSKSNKFPFNMIQRVGSWISKLVWLFDDQQRILNENYYTSPYIICIATKE